MIDASRRGFLAGLGAIAVLAIAPKTTAIVDFAEGQKSQPWTPYDVAAPEGWTYEWARSALLGEPDPENIIRRLENGWTFVDPRAHPEIAEVAEMTADRAMDVGGLILMMKSTAEVEAAQRVQFELAQARLLAMASGYGAADTAYLEEDGGV